MIIFMLIVCVIVVVTIFCVIRSPNNHSPTEDLRLLTVNSGSPSTGDIIHDGRLKVRRSKGSGTTWTPAIDRPINRYDYSNMETNNLVANQYGSNSYQDSYDTTYNGGGYGGFKQDDGNVIGIPGSTITKGPGFGVNYSPAYGPYNWPMENTPIIDHHKLTTHLPTRNTNIPTPISMTPDTNQSQIPQNRIVISIPNDFSIDWRKIGILALGKLMLVKLKTFPVIKLLFLMFKLKFITGIICVFKFILLLKFMKFFKVFLPLFLLPLFLTMLLSPLFFISIYSIPGRIVQLLRMPMGAPATPVTTPAPVSAPPSQPNVPAPSPPAPRPPAPRPPAPSPPAPSPPAPSINTLIDPFNVLNNGRPT